MEVKKMRIAEIYEDDVIYEVPYYQRYYEWEKSNVKQFLDDVKEILNVTYKNKTNHFLGILVLREFEDRDKIKKMEVIDGQQRLTTIFLIIKAMNIYYAWINKNIDEELLDSNSLSSKCSELLKLKLILNNEGKDDHTLDEIYKISLIKDDLKVHDFQEFVEKILEKIKFINKKSKIYKNFIVILDWFNANGLDIKEISDFKEKFLNFELASIDVSSFGDNPQNIFESINSKSKKLDNIDLIKNYIFMNIKLNQEQESLYNSYWIKIETSISKKELEDFFKYVVMLKEQMYIEEKDLGVFKVFKKVYKIFDLNSAKCELKNLKYWCMLYMASSIKISNEKLKDVADGYLELDQLKNYINNEFNSSKFTAYSIFFSMFLLDKYLEKRINLKQFKEIIRIVDSYILRWNICINRGNLSSPLLEICALFQDSDSNNLIIKIKEKIKQFSGQFRYFSDQELIARLSNGSISGKIQDILINLLEKKHKFKYKQDVYEEQCNKEHIRPKKIKEVSDWKPEFWGQN
ncbi:DUF262 domain-containing protein [Spiroplasma clarkii]|uniref:GmrSD restriction endonucleases N-terminal domain-containing protein n=1 Tax=Spiroplasma clarkii TaxID=2139 RepID=A0A2K8KHP4_9MOLU|nr:DUF262 domain-containing protein [Spiroplasma clarkii]ATX71197.1 hypothetical protein SCLAR_v1c08910 [Spiroplasma clarkii]